MSEFFIVTHNEFFYNLVLQFCFSSIASFYAPNSLWSYYFLDHSFSVAQYFKISKFQLSCKTLFFLLFSPWFERAERKLPDPNDREKESG